MEGFGRTLNKNVLRDAPIDEAQREGGGGAIKTAGAFSKRKIREIRGDIVSVSSRLVPS